jgi:hypothetical protein
LWQNPGNNLDVNADNIVSVLDAVLVVNDLRSNIAQGGGNTHVLYPTLQEAQAHNPPQLFVVPGVKPFVDVDGNGVVTVGDIILVINGIRSLLIGGGEAEGEALAAEGEAPEAASLAESSAPVEEPGSPSVASASFIPAPRETEAARPEENRSSLRSSQLGNELLLANASFRTYEFETALDDIAGDVSGAWNDEDDNDLEDYFPYGDMLKLESNA